MQNCKALNFLFFCLIVLLCKPYSVSASHVLAQTVTYKHLQNNIYAIEFVLFVDCKYSNIANYNIYKIQAAGTETAEQDTAYRISEFLQPLVLCSTSVCIRKEIYRDTITLGENAKGYHIYQDYCCRSTFTNIKYTRIESENNSLYTFIPARKYQNSSPEMVKDPMQILCTNKKITFNAGYSDPDGDLLIFKLVQPYNFISTAPHFIQADYANGYSVSKPFGAASPVVTIDSITGVITAEAKYTGNYLLAIEVNEYRVDRISGKSVFMGKVKVELSFLAINCGNNIAPFFDKDSSGYTRTVEVGEKLCFNVSGQDPFLSSSRLDTLKLSAYGAPMGTVPGFPLPFAEFNEVKAVKNIKSQFCWTPGCEHVTYSSPQLVTFVIEDEGCNKAEKTYSIFVKPKVHTPVLSCLNVTGENSIELSFKKPLNDSFFSAYHIYRKKLPEDSGFTKIATIKDINISGWTDVNANHARDTAYQYFITSENSCGVEMRGSDTLQSILIQLKALQFGNTEFSWNKIHPKYKDSFIIYIDSGQGLQVFDTVYSTNYIFPFCDKNIKILVEAINTDAACLSRSAVSENYFISDTIPPSPVKVEYVTVKDHSTIEVGFTKPSDLDVKSYNIYYKKNSENFKFLIRYFPADTASLITFNHSGITAGTDTFSYYISAIGSCPDNVSIPSDTHTALQLSGNPGNNSNNLGWNTYKGFEVKQYVIESWSGNKWVTLDTVNNSIQTFIHDSLPCNITRYYKVNAIDNDNSGLISISDSIALTPFDTIASSEPDLFAASVESTDKTNGKISINFAGNHEKNRSGYNIYRSTNHGSFSLLKTLTDTSTNKLLLEDAGLNTSENIYSYNITSLDSCGNESVSSDTHTTVLLKTQAFSNYIQLDWSAYEGFSAWKYVIEKRNQNTVNWNVVDTFTSAIQTYADSDISCKTYFEYRVRSIEDSGIFFSLSNISGDTAFESEAPIVNRLKNVSVTQTSEKSGEVIVEWNASVSKDVASYHLYKSTDGNNWQTEAGNISPNKLFYNVPGLNTFQSSYYFRLASIDSCGNVSDSFSNIHQSILLKSAAGNQEINLVWNAYKGWKVKAYLISRNGALYASVSGNILQFTDTLVSCKNSYSYQLTAIADSSVYLISNSNIAAAAPYDLKAPAPVYLSSVSVSVPNNEVELKWDKSASFDVENYHIYKRSPKNGQLDFVDSANNLFYIDKTNEIISPDCYFIAVKDQCGNISALSNKACIIVVKAKNKDGFNEISWNEYLQWNQGVAKYNIFKKEDSLQWLQIGSIPGTETNFTDQDLTKDIVNYCYQVEAVENPGQNNSVSFSTTVCTSQDAIFKMPNVFSPHNGDELNDKFGPVGMYVKNYSMQIFNRWGELVYETKNGLGWDGRINGKKAPEGVYFYMIYMEGYNPGLKFYCGNLSLIW